VSRQRHERSAQKEPPAISTASRHRSPHCGRALFTTKSALHSTAVPEQAVSVRRFERSFPISILPSSPYSAVSRALADIASSAIFFATASDNVVHRIDRHPVMRSHPTTPMTESDLRLHLSAQGLPLTELVSCTAIGTDADVLAGHVMHRIGTGKRHFLFDASETAHIRTIGHTLRRLQSGRRPILFVGASSVAETLTLSRTNVMPAGKADRRIARTTATKPCFIIAGSRSHVTAGQIAAARRFRKFAVEPGQIVDVSIRAAAAADCAKALREGHNVLAHLMPDQDYGIATADLARCAAEFAAAVLDDVPVPSLGIAGGDTSSIIVRRLGFESLAFGRDLDRGVAICVGSRGIRHGTVRILCSKAGRWARRRSSTSLLGDFPDP
jgi:uncharacterized protein YgbK (DUF1537 family)